MEYLLAELRLIARRLGLIGKPTVSSALAGLDKSALKLRKAQNAIIARQDLHEAKADKLRARVRGEVVASSLCEHEALRAGRVAQRIEDLTA